MKMLGHGGGHFTARLVPRIRALVALVVSIVAASFPICASAQGLPGAYQSTPVGLPTMFKALLVLESAHRDCRGLFSAYGYSDPSRSVKNYVECMRYTPRAFSLPDRLWLDMANGFFGGDLWVTPFDSVDAKEYLARLSRAGLTDMVTTCGKDSSLLQLLLLSGSPLTARTQGIPDFLDLECRSYLVAFERFIVLGCTDYRLECDRSGLAFYSGLSSLRRRRGK